MAIDRALLAEKAAAVQRHLERVRAKLPAHKADFLPGTDASDAVVLHTWQAVQMVLDVATAYHNLKQVLLRDKKDDSAFSGGMPEQRVA